MPPFRLPSAVPVIETTFSDGAVAAVTVTFTVPRARLPLESLRV